MTNEQLVCRIQAGENVAENMKLLYDQVKAFIHMIAIRYQSSGMVEDLEQEGYLALYPAIDGYDPAHGVKFLTYADRWIRQRMQRYLQMNGSSVRLPVGRVIPAGERQGSHSAGIIAYSWLDSGRSGAAAA